MKKIIMILAIVLGTMSINAQTKDTICSVFINNNSDSTVLVVHLDSIYVSTFVLKSKLQPELDNYINIAKHDYATINDTLEFLCYQNTVMSETCERVVINTQNNSYYKCLDELSSEMQMSIYLFSLKLKAIIKDEN